MFKYISNVKIYLKIYLKSQNISHQKQYLPLPAVLLLCLKRRETSEQFPPTQINFGF